MEVRFASVSADGSRPACTTAIFLEAEGHRMAMVYKIQLADLLRHQMIVDVQTCRLYDSKYRKRPFEPVIFQTSQHGFPIQ